MMHAGQVVDGPRILVRVLEEDGRAARALLALGVTRDRLVAEVARLGPAPRREGDTSGPHYTEEVQRAMVAAVHAIGQTDPDRGIVKRRMETEYYDYLLLAMLDQKHGQGVLILRELGVDLTRLRALLKN